MSSVASKVLYGLSVCIIAVGMSGCGGGGRGRNTYGTGSSGRGSSSSGGGEYGSSGHSTSTAVDCNTLAKDLSQLDTDFTQLGKSPSCAKANAGVASAQQLISTYLSSGSFQCQVMFKGNKTWVSQSSLLTALQVYFNAFSGIAKTYSCHQTPDCFDLVGTVKGIVAAQTKFEDDVFTPFINKATPLSSSGKDQVCGNLALWHKQAGDSKAPYLTQPGSTLQCKVKEDGSVFPVASLIASLDALSDGYEKASEELKCEPSLGGGSAAPTGVDPVAARKDLCKFLKLPEDASYEVLKKAYKKKAIQLHPDKNANKSPADQKAAADAMVALNGKWKAFNDSAPKTSAQVD